MLCWLVDLIIYLLEVASTPRYMAITGFMNFARSNHTAVVLDGWKIIVTGGSGFNYHLVTNVRMWKLLMGEKFLNMLLCCILCQLFILIIFFILGKIVIGMMQGISLMVIS